MDLDDAGNVDKRLPDAKEESDKQEGEEHASYLNSLPYYYKNADYYYYLEEYQDGEDDCLPPAEDESDKHEPEDASSMSSDVEYKYAEEDDGYYSSEEDEGYNSSEEDGDSKEEHKDSKEGEVDVMDSTATKKNKEIASTTDVAEKYHGKTVLDSLLEAYINSHKIKERPVICPQPLKDWVDSWKVSNHQILFVWVNVYAYYNRHKHYGGYGVILRDPVAKPITASAKFSAFGVSFFTQVLMGIKAGVTLAEKHGLSQLRVQCNSMKVPGLVFRVLNCSGVKCADNSRICKPCREYFSKSKGCSLSLVRHLREIKAMTHGGKALQDLIGKSKVLNGAAYYLAKMGKKDRKERIPLGNEGSHEIKVIRPDDFPEELKRILWEDAFQLKYYNESWLMQ